MSAVVPRAAVAAALGLAVLAGVALWMGAASSEAMPRPAPPTAVAPPVPTGGAGGSRPAAAGEAAVPSAPRGRAASLVGTDWDGGWALDPASGLPRPDGALRRRFDHLLTQLGERSPAEIRAQLVQRLQVEALAAPAQAEVLRLFDAYVKVGQHPYRVQVQAREPHTWRAALAERQTVRRQWLGWDWAEAFYGDEERSLLATLAALESGAPAAPEPEPPRHPEAAQREAAAEAAWRAWEQRLAAAAAHWRQLQGSAALSPVQRDDAWQRYLQAHFDASEQRRVRALVESGATPG